MQGILLATFALVAFVVGGSYAGPTVPWGPCPGFTSPDELLLRYGIKTPPETSQYSCYNFSVPLDWSNPLSSLIPFYVWRVESPSAKKAKNAIWVLNGGPGSDGGSIVQLSEYVFLSYLTEGYDLLIPDHRGTGFSNYLSCPDPSDPIACGTYVNETYGSALKQFTVTNAAKDLEFAIIKTKENFKYKKTFIAGLSYGSYWANRLLTLNPNIADAVIYDGVCPSTHCRFDGYDRNGNELGRKYLLACAQEPACRNRLGYNPMSTLEHIFAEIDAGIFPCQDYIKLDRGSLSLTLGLLLRNFPPYNRVVIPGVISRLLRCNSQDRTELLHSLFQPADSTSNNKVQHDAKTHTAFGLPALTNYYSWPLYYTITNSEMYTRTGAIEPTAAEAISTADHLLFTANLTLPQVLSRNYWERYPTDEYQDVYAPYSKPLLMLTGNIDAQTVPVWGNIVPQYYRNDAQHYVELPFSAHISVLMTPTDGPFTCGVQLVGDFFENPGKKLDISCINDILPFDFVGTRADTVAASEATFGTTSLYGS